MKALVNVLRFITTLMIGLKLAGFVAWSWWAVLSPAWGLILLPLAVMLAATISEARKEAEE